MPVAEIGTHQLITDYDELKGCVSVIVPIYNEVDHFDELLRQGQASPVRKEIIVVDDGSTDGTRERLMELAPAQDFTLVFHRQNCGKGAAIRTRFRSARAEYILLHDSSLHYNPHDYPA